MAHHSVEKTPTLPGNRRASRTWWPKFWEPYTRNILFACGLVVLPMVAFTMTILWVVFANRLDEARCPYSDLCPDRSHLNSNMSSENYYVAFPAGRLAFISSLSATISFGLVGILMIIFAYSTASELLIDGKDDTGKSSLPSPYQFSLIVRLLNAEVLALCEVIWDNIKMSFARKRKAVCTEREPSTTFRRCILVLTLCLFGSILIQVADTYFHIAINSKTFVDIASTSTEKNLYGRQLAPWCYNRQGSGILNNKNVWSCSLNYAEETGMIALSNNTLINEFVSGQSRDFVLEYTSDDDGHFAIVGAPQVPSYIDWKASSFAVSTQCRSLENNACDLGEDLSMQTFNCSKARSGIELSGRLTGYDIQRHHFDENKYLRPPPAFDGENFADVESVLKIARDVTDDEVDSVFSNPWRWLAVAAISVDPELLLESYKTDNRVWPRYKGGLDHMWLSCNSTVWDVTYSAVGREVTEMEATKSNGTMAGIASMSIFPIDFFASHASLAITAASTQSTPDGYVASLSRSISQLYTYSLAAQTVPSPALLVQTRSSRVVSELPMSALWVLVVANSLYALIAIVLATLALMSASDAVHQVKTRLGTAGLAAALFAGAHSQNAADSDKSLFGETIIREHTLPKRVGLMRTDTGGSSFKTLEV